MPLLQGFCTKLGEATLGTGDYTIFTPMFHEKLLMQPFTNPCSRVPGKSSHHGSLLILPDRMRAALHKSSPHSPQPPKPSPAASRRTLVSSSLSPGHEQWAPVTLTFKYRRGANVPTDGSAGGMGAEGCLKEGRTPGARSLRTALKGCVSMGDRTQMRTWH